MANQNTTNEDSNDEETAPIPIIASNNDDETSPPLTNEETTAAPVLTETPPLTETQRITQSLLRAHALNQANNTVISLAHPDSSDSSNNPTMSEANRLLTRQFFNQGNRRAFEAERSTSELYPGNNVIVTNLTGEKGAALNGKSGVVMPLTSSSTSAASSRDKALRADGRYTVNVTINENEEQIRPGRIKIHQIKKVKLKRENLKLVVNNMMRNETFMNIIKSDQLGLILTTETETKHPGVKGLFDFIKDGDVEKVRGIMEYMKEEFNTDVPANYHRDGSGNAHVVKAIKYGQVEIVKLLFEYGADANDSLGTVMKEEHTSLLHLVAKTMQQDYTDISQDKLEAVMNILLENGADVKAVSGHDGSIINILLRFEKLRQHESRMRMMRKVLELGADPNVLVHIKNSEGAHWLPIVDSIPITYGGPFQHRTEILELLLEYGGDPGKMCNRGLSHDCNAIILAASLSLPNILETLLKSDLGRKAVNSKHVTNNIATGENSLFMTIADENLQKKSIVRETVVTLLKYGADAYQRRDDGCQPYQWLTLSDKHKELKSILDKAPTRTKRQKTLDYWDVDKNPKVKAFVGNRSKDYQCPVCLIWSHMMRGFQGRRSSEFKKCSGCEKQMYCSQACQKKHWAYHKTVCRLVPKNKCS